MMETSNIKVQSSEKHQTSNSKKDFRNKVYIAKKEAQETKHWLRMLQAAAPERKEQLYKFRQEAHELVLILQSIINKVGGRVEKDV